MGKKHKAAQKAENPKAGLPAQEPWPFPPLNMPPGGGDWTPPEGVRDIAVIGPFGWATPKDFGKLDLPFRCIEGLDGAYILSSDGSTRPYGGGH